MCGASLCAGNATSEQKPLQQPTEKKAAKKAAAKKAAADKKATAAGAATGKPHQPANVGPEPDVEAQPKAHPKAKSKGKAKQSATPSAAGSQPPAKKTKVTWAGELGGAAASPTPLHKKPAAVQSDDAPACNKTVYTIMLYKSRGMAAVREVGNGGRQVLQAQMPTWIKIT